MSDNTATQVLGASTAVVLPATAAAATGINLFYYISIIIGALVGVNIVLLVVKKFLQNR